MAGLLASTPALAISDDANPWLAIENAMCVAHRIVDYQALVGATVVIKTTEWIGARSNMPTHCHIAGTIDDASFDFKLPITWNGTLSSGDCVAPQSLEALNLGAATVFGDASAQTSVLLSAVTARHYDAPITQQIWVDCR